ncbi:MAG: efflux transporter periplasmic adaptor subunit [Alphaproteobacteria bacterium]|nr:MAG: efflux transporter periplasmic adaptor subunit [Alphaproteobacteria bacterium]
MMLAVALAGCGADGARGAAKAGGKQPPLVAVVTPRPHRFISRIEAVGTARANEQVTLSSAVTERIDRLSFRDGGFVQKGQIIAMLAQGEEQAALAGARAEAKQAQHQLERVQALGARGFATGALVELQEATARRAQAQAASAEAQIADRVIRAPFAGFASLRTISEGAIVNSGAPIATISDLSRIKLDFTVPETALRSLRRGQPIIATAAAWPDQPVRGTIETIDPVIDPATRAVTVRAVLANPDTRLKPGMLLTIAIEAEAREGWAVPEMAITGDGADRFVHVVDAAGKARRKRVVVGVRDAGLIEVTGLPADARVITEGVVKVSDGSRVRIRGGEPKVVAAP